VCLVGLSAAAIIPPAAVYACFPEPSVLTTALHFSVSSRNTRHCQRYLLHTSRGIFNNCPHRYHIPDNYIRNAKYLPGVTGYCNLNGLVTPLVNVTRSRYKRPAWITYRSYKIGWIDRWVVITSIANIRTWIVAASGYNHDDRNKNTKIWEGFHYPIHRFPPLCCFFIIHIYQRNISLTRIILSFFI
jgi:hypothetical protein